MDAAVLRKPSLTLRIGIGKLVGFLFGLMAMVFLTIFDAPVDWAFNWGIVFWYATVGAIIGAFGIYVDHPVLKLPMPWWMRAGIIGGWMNLLLALFIHDKLAVLGPTILNLNNSSTINIGFVFEGVFVGLIIGWIATRFGGEGPETVRGV